MKKHMFALIATALLLVGCGPDHASSVYSEHNDDAIANGYPELARKLGRVNTDCVLQKEDWQAVFLEENIVTGRRINVAINRMVQHGQILWFQDKQAMALTANYCQQPE